MGVFSACRPPSGSGSGSGAVPGLWSAGSRLEADEASAVPGPQRGPSTVISATSSGFYWHAEGIVKTHRSALQRSPTSLLPSPSCGSQEPPRHHPSSPGLPAEGFLDRLTSPFLPSYPPPSSLPLVITGTPVCQYGRASRCVEGDKSSSTNTVETRYT